jgi:nitroreductase
MTPWQVQESGFPHQGTGREKLTFLLRYAILAPSTRNTQPWKFGVSDDSIRLFVDTTHWLRVADADQREMYLSLGCALENLILAADHFNYITHVHYGSSPLNPELAATVHFVADAAHAPSRFSCLFQSISRRCTQHGTFNAKPVPREAQQQIQDCSTIDPVHLYLTEEEAIRRKVDGLIARADALEFANPDFRAELAHLIGQGVFGTSWLLSVIGEMAISYLNLGQSFAKKDHELLMSSPILGLICTPQNDREAQIKAGRVFQRVCLMAHHLGLLVHPMSQIVQIPEIRSELAGLVPHSDLYPMQPFRLGYGEPPRHHTPRRPLEEVLM